MRSVLKAPDFMRTPPRRPSVYDVTTKPREKADPPPSPTRTPDGPSPRTVLLRAVRPVVLVLAVVGLALAIKVIANRLRPPSVDGPALSRAGWRASGYPSASRPAAALDGDRRTGWVTRSGQGTDAWFAVDMGQPRTFHQVVMDTGANVDDYPRGYAVYLSGDCAHWGRAVAGGSGSAPLTIVDLGPRTARGIKVVQTGEAIDSPWTICEFTVH